MVFFRYGVPVTPVQGKANYLEYSPKFECMRPRDMKGKPYGGPSKKENMIQGAIKYGYDVSVNVQYRHIPGWAAWGRVEQKGDIC